MNIIFKHKCSQTYLEKFAGRQENPLRCILWKCKDSGPYVPFFCVCVCVLCIDLFNVAYQLIWQVWESAKVAIKFGQKKPHSNKSCIRHAIFFCSLITKSLASCNRINLGQRSESDKYMLIGRFWTFQQCLLKFLICLNAHSRLDNFLTNNLANSLQWTGKRGCEKLHALSSKEDDEKKRQTAE